MAEGRSRFPEADRAALLDDLATALFGLGELGRATQLMQDRLKLSPDNLDALSKLASLALASGNLPEVGKIAERLKSVEGKEGTLWRYVDSQRLLAEAGNSDSAHRDSLVKLATKEVDEILAARPEWWAGPLLRGQIAELAGKPQEAVRDYLRALDLGSTEVGLARHAFVLLYELQQFDQIDQLVAKLGERGAAPADLKLATALNALRRGDMNRGVSLAREVLPEDSKTPSDLLVLCRILIQAGRVDEAEKPLRRARTLAPGLPDVWATEVQFLLAAGRGQEIRGVLEQAASALPKDQAALDAGSLSFAGGQRHGRRPVLPGRPRPEPDRRGNAQAGRRVPHQALRARQGLALD